MDSPVCRKKAMFTAHSLRSLETLSAQRILSFSFTVERTVNENHPKLRFIWFVSQNTTISIESMIRCRIRGSNLYSWQLKRGEKKFGSKATYRDERGRMIVMSHSIPFIFFDRYGVWGRYHHIVPTTIQQLPALFFLPPQRVSSKPIKTERCHHLKGGPLW